MRSTQNVHFVATARRESSRRFVSFAIGVPYAKPARIVLWRAWYGQATAQYAQPMHRS